MIRTRQGHWRDVRTFLHNPVQSRSEALEHFFLSYKMFKSRGKRLQHMLDLREVTKTVFVKDK